ncbi:MAG: DUF6498-containing protein, partial [Burkholderiales bacterium]
IRFALWDNATGATPLELPKRRMWPVGIVFGVFFAAFAAAEAAMIVKASSHQVRGVFDLMMFLFDVFWILGWSIGVLILGGLTVLFLLYRETAWLQKRHLVHVPQLGPLKIICRYELEGIRNLRIEPTKKGDATRIRFDYDGRTSKIGDSMPRHEAEALIEQIERAGAGTAPLDPQPPTISVAPRPKPALAAPNCDGIWTPSTLALVAANLLPLAGVLLFGWNLAAVMVLYWAESAVIGFYTVLKMCVVGKLGAIVGVPFFLGHFGGFMAAHFAFVYGLFIHGGGTALPDVGAFAELREIFLPLWPALVGLLVSHGISFFVNFIGEREHEGSSMSELMTVPYRRLVVMHVTVILGGWIVLALGTPSPALLVLIAMKIFVDLRAHRREHAAIPPRV